MLAMGSGDLTDVVAAGHPINPTLLDDTEYQGISLGLPAIVDKLAWKTFQKTFHRDPATGELRGWNVRLRQSGLEGEIVPKLKRGAPFTWGHYRVVANAGRPSPKPWCDSLLIDYSVAANSRFGATYRMRDPLVALEAGSAGTLLGWSYVQLGHRQVSTPSFFLLRNPRPLSHVVSEANELTSYDFPFPRG